MDDVVPLAQALFTKLSAIRNFCLTQEGQQQQAPTPRQWPGMGIGGMGGIPGIPGMGQGWGQGLYPQRRSQTLGHQELLPHSGSRGGQDRVHHEPHEE